VKGIKFDLGQGERRGDIHRSDSESSKRWGRSRFSVRLRGQCRSLFATACEMESAANDAQCLRHRDEQIDLIAGGVPTSMCKEVAKAPEDVRHLFQIWSRDGVFEFQLRFGQRCERRRCVLEMRLLPQPTEAAEEENVGCRGKVGVCKESFDLDSWIHATRISQCRMIKVMLICRQGATPALRFKFRSFFSDVSYCHHSYSYTRAIIILSIIQASKTHAFAATEI
jgi:hypothetical protein